MMVKLEMGFESMEELRKYLDAAVPHRDCCCAKPVPDPMPVDLEPKAVPQMVQPAPPMVQPPAPVPTNEVEPVTPPQMVTAPPPVEPAPMPTPQEVTPPSAPTVSTAAHEYKLEDIARAGASLVDIGKQAELPGLLARFGVASLPELTPDKFGEMATALREMGARI